MRTLFQLLTNLMNKLFANRSSLKFLGTNLSKGGKKSRLAIQVRDFSSSSIRQNDIVENTTKVSDSWSEFTYKLHPKQSKVNSSSLNSCLLSFYTKILKDVSESQLIVISLRVKLSNNKEVFISNVRFHKTGIGMFHKIFYLLNKDLLLKDAHYSKDYKELSHTEIVLKYDIRI